MVDYADFVHTLGKQFHAARRQQLEACPVIRGETDMPEGDYLVGYKDMDGSAYLLEVTVKNGHYEAVGAPTGFKLSDIKVSKRLDK